MLWRVVKSLSSFAQWFTGLLAAGESDGGLNSGSFLAGKMEGSQAVVDTLLLRVADLDK